MNIAKKCSKILVFGKTAFSGSQFLAVVYKKLDNKSSQPKMETLRQIEKYQINSIKIKWEEMAKTKVTEISKLTLTNTCLNGDIPETRTQRITRSDQQADFRLYALPFSAAEITSGAMQTGVPTQVSNTLVSLVILDHPKSLTLILLCGCLFDQAASFPT